MSEQSDGKHDVVSVLSYPRPGAIPEADKGQELPLERTKSRPGAKVGADDRA